MPYAEPYRYRRRPLVWDCLLSAWSLLRTPGRSYRGTLPEADDALRQRTDRLRRDVVRLADEIGPRDAQQHPESLRRAADYIERQFVAAGYRPRRQSYPVADVSCVNLDVELRGAIHPEEIVVIGAHYDTVPGSPGANDNASGVAAMLALARAMAGHSSNRTLRLAAFVNEEKPYAHTEAMGSMVYAGACRRRGDRIVAMLCLETIGCYRDEPGSQRYPPLLRRIYPSRGDFIAFLSNTRSRRLLRRLLATFRRSEPFPSHGAALPEIVSGIHRSDHRSFWHAGYPAVMVTDTAPYRYPYYHTADDTPEKLDYDRAARVVRGLEAVVGQLIGAEGITTGGRCHAPRG